MRLRTFAPLLVALGLVGSAVGAGVVDAPAHTAAAPRASSAPVLTTSVVCPAVAPGKTSLVSTVTVANVASALPTAASGHVTVTATPLVGAAAKPRTLDPQPVAHLTTTSSLLVTADGPGAANIVADQVGLQETGLGRASSGIACSAPAGDWWFVGAEGRVGYFDTLYVANPGANVANVAVQAWASTGPLHPAGLDAIVVMPRSVVALDVSRFAPDAAYVSLHVHATSGSVVASVRDRQISGIHARGVDWLPATIAPARSLVIPPMPEGAGSRRLFLTNPGSSGATVSLRLVTPSRNFQPAGLQSVVLPAGKTVRLPLTRAATDETASVLVSSDQPVLAGAVMSQAVHRRLPDIAWVSAQAPITGAAAFVTDRAPLDQDVRLLLTAPDGAVRVRLTSVRGTSVTVTVQAGRCVSIDLRHALRAGADVGPVVLTPLDPSPVYAVRMLRAIGAHGGLLTTEVPVTLASPVALPPVVADPRAAVR